MGLDRNGFTADTYEEIFARITSRMIAYDNTIDIEVESPDGQWANIFAFELSMAYEEMKKVHYSYDPFTTTGLALKNLGLITGYQYGVGTRSRATVEVTGTAGVTVIKGSIVTDNDGNEFVTQADILIPGNVQVIATLSGPTPIGIGAITTVKTVQTGWTGVNQANAGIIGTGPQTEESFRNIRNKTVLRNYTSVASTIRSKLIELGIEQVAVVDNKSLSALPDGTPAGAIHVTIGESTGISDADIAKTIAISMNVATSTFGSTSVVTQDSQGVDITINFDKATAVNIEITVNLTYLSTDIAGADEAIKDALAEKINGLSTGGDIIHSHLYGLITPHGDAQIDSLLIGEVGQANQVAANFVVGDDEFAAIDIADILIA